MDASLVLLLLAALRAGRFVTYHGRVSYVVDYRLALRAVLICLQVFALFDIS
jgi:hypothetical protein